jgi:FKBP-type peptidyl-prolyl cis-trans isomerase
MDTDRTPHPCSELLVALFLLGASSSCGSESNPETSPANAGPPGETRDDADDRQRDSAAQGVTPLPERRELEGGMVVEVRGDARGPAAAPGDALRLHLVGTLATDGTVITTTRSSGIPERFVLCSGDLIAGLEQALAGLRAGQVCTVRVPAALAYGEAGLGTVPPGADLIFEIEVVAVEPRR